MVKIINGEIVSDDDPRLQQRHQPNAPGARATAAQAPDGTRRPTAAPGGSAAGGGAAGGGAGGAAGGIGFSLSAPPLRFVPPPLGVEPLLGLPDAEVFGVRLSPYAVLSAVALGAFFGWRGVVMVLVLYYVYLASQNNAAAAQGQGQGQQPGARPGAAGEAGSRQGAGQAAGAQQPPPPQQQQQQYGNMAADFLQRYLNGPQPRSRSRPGAGPSSGAGADMAGSVGAEGPARQEGGEGPGAALGGGWAAFQGRGNKLGGK